MGTKHIPAIIRDDMLSMKTRGHTHREIATETGYTKTQVDKFFERQNKKARTEEAGMVLRKQRDRKPAVTLAEYKYENKRLKMENELLRDFISLAERR